ncbi:MAG: hypothetical protein ACUZ8I_03855, partial [Candidatus Scalindua sp.]
LPTPIKSLKLSKIPCAIWPVTTQILMGLLRRPFDKVFYYLSLSEKVNRKNTLYPQQATKDWFF